MLTSSLYSYIVYVKAIKSWFNNYYVVTNLDLDWVQSAPIIAHAVKSKSFDCNTRVYI
jgi:hypothetical protein